MAFFGNLVVCDWCDDKITAIQMLHIDLWAKLSDGKIDDIMCVECMETKLGREPNAHDCRKPWWPYE
jgi:hypothetical protein